ncbi:MAG: DUF2079 domain-containing protein [Anaerolineales bacterium]|nr:DUF2079 domain-containing protein [Anaerolineales bacterium]
MKRITHIIRRHWPLLLMVVLWTGIMAAFAIARHERLNSTVYDLGIKSQVIWNTSQGRWFASSIEVTHYLGDHVQFIMLLLAPLFWIWANVNVLLITQSVMLGLGAIPVYRLAQRHLKQRRLALLFAALYLLYPTVNFINRFDFHPMVFAIFFLLLALDLLEEERPYWATLSIFLALSLREDVGFTVFMMGLFVALVLKRRRLGIIWALGGLAWSLTTLFVIIPTFRGAASDTISRYGWLGNSSSDMLHTLLTQPGLVVNHLWQPFRRAFLVKLFLPVGFLALLSPLPLLVGIPVLAYNLLSETPSQSSIYFQYAAPFIPFIFYAAIQGTARLQNWLAKHTPRSASLLALWLVASMALAWALDNPFTQKINDPFYPVYGLEQLSDAAAFHEAAALVPADAPVATMMNYGTHLALRPELYLFYDRIKLEERPFGFPQVDYLLLHLSDLRWGVNTRLFYRAVETAVAQFGYEAIFFKHDVVLLTRQESSRPETGAVLQRVQDLLAAGGEFAPTAPTTLQWMGEQWVVDGLPETAVSTPTQFNDHIRLLGYQLNETDHYPGQALCTTLYWQTDVPILQDYTIFLHLVAPDGFVQAQQDGQPAQGFRPMTAWKTGETLADQHCLRLPLGLAAGEYTLKTGLYDSATGNRLLAASTTNPIQDDAVTLTNLTISPK